MMMMVDFYLQFLSLLLLINLLNTKYIEFLMRNSGQTEVGLETNNAAFLEDVAQNADLYIANQSVSMQI